MSDSAREHFVIYDGTPNRPLQRMIFGPESTAIAPPLEEHESHRGVRTGTFDTVRRELSVSDRAWSAKELAAETRLRRQQVAVALYACYQQGLTTKSGSHPVRYRWKG